MPELDADKCKFNPFDRDEGLAAQGLSDDRCRHDGTESSNPENYFAEIEQSAFSPSNIVPGISFSPDKMLQARIFSYADAHRYRVGTWYEKLPVNAPKSAVRTYHLDGQMVFDAPKGTDAYYEPNSFAGPVQDSAFAEPPLRIKGDADRFNHREGNDDYKQPGDLFRLMSDSQKEQLFHNIAGTMEGIPQNIIDRQLEHFAKADPAYAEGVKRRAGEASGIRGRGPRRARPEARTGGRTMSNAPAITAAEESRYAELQVQALDHARSGETGVLESMVRAGLPVNLADHSRNTLLMLACYHGHAGTARLLLERGADVDRRNARNQTPLGGVAFKGYAEVARVLLEHGASVDADNGNGMTPLMFAEMFGRTEVAEILRQAGADAKSRNRYGLSAGALGKTAFLWRGLMRLVKRT